MIDRFFKAVAGRAGEIPEDRAVRRNGKSQRIEFLKEIALTKNISSKCLASALKILRELKFRDRAFYKQVFAAPRQLGVPWPARRR